MPIFGAEIPCGSRAGFDIVGIRCGSSANKEEDRSMRKIIIDTDPGIDDAAAIAIAMFSPELDVQLITTVSGNVSVEKTTHNALRLMTLWNAGVPVAAGASRSLTGMQYDAGDTHGESGMDGFAFDEVTVQPVKLHAVEAMRRVLERSEEKVTLVPIGPLTNLALLFVQYPEVKEKIEEIVYRSLVMKKNVVERDEREAGLRATLNFGHTLGHAIESANHLGGLYHGECVALGMLPMIEDASLRRRTRAVYKKLGLPSRIRYDGDEIFEFIRHDKKTGPDGAITVVKVPRLGECRLDKVPLEDLKAIIGEGVR